MSSTADRAATPDAPSRTEDLAAPAGARRATRRGRDTQRRLIAAAHEMFNTKPFDDTRIVDITARAGVSAGSFYTYFASKEALFQVVAEHVLEAMYGAPSRERGNTERNPVRDIADASRQYFQVCLEHRMIAQSIERLRTAQPEVGASRRGVLLRGVKRTAEWIERLQVQGICNPSLDPWYTALALQAMNISVAYDQLVHRDEPDDIEALVAAVTPIWARAVGLDAWL
ncbi:MAG: TetR/AcrR family transcriptional regulator [Acidimicrobiales bacterium]